LFWQPARNKSGSRIIIDLFIIKSDYRFPELVIGLFE
jgi:hypothetical protein